VSAFANSLASFGIKAIYCHFFDERNKPDISVVVKGKVNQSHYRPEVPRGFQDVKVPRLRDSGSGWW